MLILSKRVIAEFFLKYAYVPLLLLYSFIISMIRTNIKDWKVLYLQSFDQIQHNQLESITLLLGIVVAGLFSDKLFSGKYYKTNFLFGIGVIVLLGIFWFVPNDIVNSWYNILIIALSFFTYGIQILIIAIALEFSYKNLRCTILGMLFSFMLISGALSYFAMGFLVEHIGFKFYFRAIWPALILCVILLLFGVRHFQITRLSQIEK